MQTDSTLSIIRTKLTHYVNRRARAYEFALSKGYAVEEYALKVRAITSLRIQLQASVTWSLHSNLQWIHVMHAELIKILPSEFSDHKQKKYRKHILDLITFCEDLLTNNSSIQKLTPNAYASRKEETEVRSR